MVLDLSRRATGTAEAAVALWDADLAGVRPARQQRSRETALALVAAGRELLKDRPLDALSIEELCEAAGCTVGAFYSRFEGKEAFFGAVQFVLCRERDVIVMRLLPEIARTCHDLAATASTIVRDLLGWYRQNHGVLRASLQHARHGRNAWKPLQELGAAHRALWLELLRPHLPPALSARQQRMRVLFGFQVVNGTLVHMLLNDPGPLKLGDHAVAPELSAVLVQYLSVASANG
jgi:AcrR family transcriptional regulator